MVILKIILVQICHILPVRIRRFLHIHLVLSTQIYFAYFFFLINRTFYFTFTKLNSIFLFYQFKLLWNYLLLINCHLFLLYLLLASMSMWTFFIETSTNWFTLTTVTDSENIFPRQLSPEVIQALRGVRFIAQHIKDADKDNEVNAIKYLQLYCTG